MYAGKANKSLYFKVQILFSAKETKKDQAQKTSIKNQQIINFYQKFSQGKTIKDQVFHFNNNIQR